MKQIYFKSRTQWRTWLSRNHNKTSGIWLVFYKKETGKPTLEYDDAVEEALCFGWIDSIIKNIDDEKFARKMTPRNDDSKWSAINIKRVDRLIKNRLMAAPGLKKVETAKKAGLFKPTTAPEISFEIPEEFDTELKKNKKAGNFFDQLAPSYRKNFIGWIVVAKRPETKTKRIKESIKLLEQGKKLDLK